MDDLDSPRAVNDAASQQTLAATTGGESSAHDGEGLARGATVGRYVVLDELGAGGMGVVHAAYDPELDRKVALKVLHAAVREGSQGRMRLLREAQALAKLSHPNIVAVHDVGTVGEQVWIAMEFIAGRTLRAWLDEGRRSWREVLEVMSAAGRGLAAAHTEGLVHRDFKPDNVMLGDDGRVRVTDFGLARAVTEIDEGSSLDEAPVRRALHESMTHPGSLSGTPAYMAAERLGGGVADARADQFAFCVTLFEGLYGERPFRGESLVELAVAVLDGRVGPRPRTARVPSWLRRAVTRGLSPRPSERWPTMTELLVALERGAARGRRAWFVAGAATVVLAGVAAWGGWRLDVERRRRQCEGEAGEIAEVWNDAAKTRLHDALVGTGVPYASSTFEHAVPFVDAHVQAWRDTYAELCIANALEHTRSAAQWEASRACLDGRRGELAALVEALSDQPDATAVQRTVGSAAGLAPLERCRDDARLAHDQSADVDEATASDLRTRLWRVGGLSAAGKYAEGLPLALAVVDDARAAGHAGLLRDALLSAGTLSESTAAYDESERLLGEAFDLALAADDQDDAREAARSLVHAVGVSQARHDEALWWGRIARGLAARLGPEQELEGARVEVGVANVHYRRASYEQAQRLYEGAIAIQERVLGPDDPELAASLNSLGLTHHERGAYDDALLLYNRALAIRERALGPDHPSVASSLSNLAALQHERGSYDEALRLYERVRALNERALGPEHPDVAAALNNLGNAHSARGSYDEAQRLHERALAIRERAQGSDHPDVATSLNNLAQLHHARGSYDEAWRLAERALGIWEQALGPDHPTVGTALGNLAEVQLARGSIDEAVRLQTRSLAIRERALGPDHPDVARPLVQLANIHDGREAHDEALQLYARALAIWERALGPDHADLGYALVGLARSELAKGRHADARAHAERAVLLLTRHRADPNLRGEAELALARALWAGGELDPARTHARAARDSFREVGSRSEASLAAAEAWLSEHEAKR